MSRTQPKAFSALFKETTTPPKAEPLNKAEETPRQVNLRLNESAKKQLDIMAAEGDTTRQALIVEAINDFFRKCGKPPIA